MKHKIRFLLIILTSILVLPHLASTADITIDTNVYKMGEISISGREFQHNGQRYNYVETTLPITHKESNTKSTVIVVEIFDQNNNVVGSKQYLQTDIRINSELTGKVTKEISQSQQQIINMSLGKIGVGAKPKGLDQQLTLSRDNISSNLSHEADLNLLSKSFGEVINQNQQWVQSRSEAIAKAIKQRNDDITNFYNTGLNIAISITKHNNAKSVEIIDSAAYVLAEKSLQISDSQFAAIMLAARDPSKEIKTHEVLTRREFQDKLDDYYSDLANGNAIQAAFKINVLIQPTVSIKGGSKTEFLKKIILPDGRAFLNAKELLYETPFTSHDEEQNLKLVKIANIYQAILAQGGRSITDENFNSLFLGGSLQLRNSDFLSQLGQGYQKQAEYSYLASKEIAYALAGVVTGGVVALTQFTRLGAVLSRLVPGIEKLIDKPEFGKNLLLAGIDSCAEQLKPGLSLVIRENIHSISQTPSFQLSFYGGRALVGAVIMYIQRGQAAGELKGASMVVPVLNYSNMIKESISPVKDQVLPALMQGRSFNSLDYAIGEGTELGRWFQENIKNKGVMK